MSWKNVIYVEYLKLFRRSNLVFLFLAAYLFITPIGRGFDELKAAETITSTDLFFAMVNAFSFMGLLLLAIFMVNNTGNDFQEGSYKKCLAIGLSQQAYFLSKLGLSAFLGLFVISSSLIVYFVFSIFLFKAGFGATVLGISWYSLLNQLVALFGAAFFGLFMIMVFRNRTIGLVFFPFWFFTELIVYIIDRSGARNLFSSYLPGVSFYELYTLPVFDLKVMAIAVIYVTLFLTSAWYGLVLREIRAV